ncbi:MULTISPECIES: OmpA family protein [unclassified Treponema]|uniref:OmpA family protein n=1 Tax=unclassified Treponema TaxID=2638727 RepID=UPI0020A438C2|nr:MULTISPECIES: OmpA family protein [unclassified Treponema]UTC67772.1 OmpA family protein [Treponema sp. OMZ 789]UTC70497.1 OmpA family protein [Treponema sp. OMZ 790]UTC73209.1 OmpA family protein [Treponema sp. OMZ 791]
MINIQPAENWRIIMRHHFTKKFFLICIILISCLSLLLGQENLSGGKIVITERADYSVYVDGKYAGLTSRETRLYMSETKLDTGDAYLYEGEAFVLQKTRKDGHKAALPIDSILPISFKFIPEQDEEDIENPYQPQIFTEDEGYPLLRNFPILPEKAFTPEDIGKTWEGKCTVSVKPKPEKAAVRIPVNAGFKYKGKTIFNGKSVHHVEAAFGLLYKGTDILGDEELIRSEGGRKADIYLDDTKRPIFIREKIDEEFFYSGGKKIKHRGFLLHFYSYTGIALVTNTPAQEAHKQDRSSNGGKAEIKPNKDFEVSKTKRGTMLRLKNLQFEPDRAVLLKGEEAKLDEIAKILKESDGSFFFVEGHTADVGRPEEEKILSQERAKTIIEKLTEKGISAEKFIYQGAGGTRPLATNSTEEGRAQNRRVEITIID